MSKSNEAQGPYPPEFLARVDKFIHLANELAQGQDTGVVSAALLFAAGRYNAFNYLSKGGSEDERDKAADYYADEYRRAFLQNIAGTVGPVIDKKK